MTERACYDIVKEFPIVDMNQFNKSINQTSHE
jgi:hypothetical protein